MKNSVRKLISAIMVLVMVVSLLPLTAFAADVQEGRSEEGPQIVVGEKQDTPKEQADGPKAGDKTADGEAAPKAGVKPTEETPGAPEDNDKPEDDDLS